MNGCNTTIILPRRTRHGELLFDTCGKFCVCSRKIALIGGGDMAVKTKIPLEKIMALKKRLQNLPPKDTGKTRDEAMEILAPVFQHALRKGYSLKELRGMSTEEGVFVALSALNEKKPKEQEAEVQKNAASGISPQKAAERQKSPEQGTHVQQADTGNTPSAPQTVGIPLEKRQPPVRKIAAEAGKNTAQADEQSAHAIIVKPDTPDEEL
jgi:hypothetical protein